MNKSKMLLSALAMGLVMLLCLLFAQQTIKAGPPSASIQSALEAIEQLPALSADSVPPVGTFYSAQNPHWPPLPGNLNSVPVWNLGDGFFLLDDRAVDYSTPLNSGGTRAMEEGEIIPPGIGGNGGTNGFDYSFTPLVFNTNQLWLEITGITNQEVNITAHNVITGWFQLLSKTNLLDNDWTAEQDNDLITDAQNELALYPVAELNPGATNSQMFFWARQSDTEVGVSGSGAVLRPSPGFASDPAFFTITRFFWPNPNGSLYSNLVVHFSLSGTASNGVDYVLRNYDTREILTNSITIPAQYDTALIELDPTTNLLCLSNLTVTLTLEENPDYLVESYYPAASITIDFNEFCLIATMPNPCGMDYHPPTQSLIVSSFDSGNWRFKRIDTNGVVTQWSGIQLPANSPTYELKLVTVKTTANGFINGAMYFDNVPNGNIGWLSPDSTVSNLTFVTVSGGQFYGLYVDQSGSFNGDLVAAQSDNGGIWRINASGVASHFVTSGVGSLLEGISSLTNDTNQYGPWAGKIITGDPSDPGSIYLIGTNGTVAGSPWNSEVEDCDIIMTNQNLYCNDSDAGWVLKLSGDIFTNHVGDILITRSGIDIPAALVIVHWDVTSEIFVTTQIPIPKYISNFEHVGFAPIDIPPVSPPVLP
jgi:hypothetical protein